MRYFLVSTLLPSKLPEELGSCLQRAERTPDVAAVESHAFWQLTPRSTFGSLRVPAEAEARDSDVLAGIRSSFAPLVKPPGLTVEIRIDEPQILRRHSSADSSGDRGDRLLEHDAGLKMGDTVLSLRGSALKIVYRAVLFVCSMRDFLISTLLPSKLPEELGSCLQRAERTPGVAAVESHAFWQLTPRSTFGSLRVPAEAEARDSDVLAGIRSSFAPPRQASGLDRRNPNRWAPDTENALLSRSIAPCPEHGVP
ncbi:hypothetical protein DIPPA_34649 [Diplonema papillatum]|nr:hypothetical protein DIPPA_34649 [Diplonema papillatum]